MPFYAVAKGRQTGVFNSWDECNQHVKGFPGSRYKKFNTREEAHDFVNNVGQMSSRTERRNFENAKTNVRRKSSRSRSPLQRRHVAVKLEINRKVVYTDGACSNNGRHSARAGVGVFWSEDDVDNVSEALGEGPQTNNRAEYMAVIRALETAHRRKYPQLTVRTDSNLLVRSLKEWMPGWKRKDWKTATGQDVKNRDLLERIDALRTGFDVEFEHVDGHSGIHGNEMADQLARNGARLS